MAAINTNMAANIASNAMTRNEISMSATMERLSTGLARTQIIQQAAIAMLAQANQSKQSVLALLRSL